MSRLIYLLDESEDKGAYRADSNAICENTFYGYKKQMLSLCF